MGAAYGTAKSGVGLCAMAIMKPDLIMRSVVPIVMAGIVAIYGVVVAVLISNKIKDATDISQVTLIFIRIVPKKLYFDQFGKIINSAKTCSSTLLLQQITSAYTASTVEV